MVSFSYFPALLQLCVFLFILVFLAAVLATQMFKVLPTTEVDFELEPFSDLWKSFLGMYQIFTGEDWTKLLYTVTQRESGQKMGWVGAIFIIGWFTISSIIILNMFISRIDDSLNIPDDKRRFFQIRNFFRQKTEASRNSSTFDYTHVSKGTALTDLYTTMQTKTHVSTMVGKFLGDDELLKQFLAPSTHGLDIEKKRGLKAWSCFAAAKVRIVWQIVFPAKRRPILPFSIRPIAKYYSKLQQGCRILLDQQTADGHPRSWSRYTLKISFTTFICMSIISQTLVTCVTTPLYQREYYMTHEFVVKDWIFMTDLGFAILWSIEAMVRLLLADSSWEQMPIFEVGISSMP
jgi:hypothetical protein